MPTELKKRKRKRPVKTDQRKIRKGKEQLDQELENPGGGHKKGLHSLKDGCIRPAKPLIKKSERKELHEN